SVQSTTKGLTTPHALEVHEPMAIQDNTTTVPEPHQVKMLKMGRLDLAGFESDCAIVEGPDRKPLRVLSGRKMHAALGGGDRRDAIVLPVGQLGGGEERAIKDYGEYIQLPPFLSQATLRPFISDSALPYLIPVRYRTPTGMKGYAYPAELLPEVCDIYLSARDAGALFPHQLHIAERCYRLMRAFAKVGIIALVDEVTGYQEHREKDELQRLIQTYLGTSAAPWVHTFTEDFYREVFRLLGLRYIPGSNQRPPRVGQFTSQAIYSQILPIPVYDELKARNPFRGRNIRQVLHHQWLSNETGRQALQAQLALVLQLMRRSASEDQFWNFLEYGGPRSQMLLPFFDTPIPRQVALVP